MMIPKHHLTTYSDIQHSIRVEVQPFYVPERSSPAQSIYFYAYAITISNEGSEVCQLLRRSWVIKNGRGEEERVEGEGVVGKQPRILPGKSFKYASFCPLQTPYGNMRGRYQLCGDFRGYFWVRVPLFFFRPPEGVVRSTYLI